MIIEKPSDRNAWHAMDSGRQCLPHEFVYGDQVTATDLFGKKIAGTLIRINESGMPAAIFSGCQTYERCAITGYFYRS